MKRRLLITMFTIAISVATAAPASAGFSTSPGRHATTRPSIEMPTQP